MPFSMTLATLQTCCLSFPFRTVGTATFSIGSLKRLAFATWFANYNDERYHTKLFCMRLADLLLSDTETNIINLGWWKTATATFSFSKRPGQLVTMKFYTLHFFLIVQCWFFPFSTAELRPRKTKRLSNTGACRIGTRAANLLPDLCAQTTVLAFLTMEMDVPEPCDPQALKRGLKISVILILASPPTSTLLPR